MVQNITVTPGTGATVAADLVGSALMQQVKINLGATNTDGGLISNTNPMPMVAISSIPLVNTSAAYAHSASVTAYAYGQIWSNNTSGSVTFPTITVSSANNQAVNITGGSLQKSGVVTTNAIFRIHLFSAAPTSSLVDRGTWQGGVTLANEIGTMDCTINDAGTDVSWGSLVPSFGTQISTLPVSGAQTLYWAVEVRGAYTPISAETITLTLDVN